MNDAHHSQPLHGQTIALAGLYQAARLVQQTAHGQVRDPLATQTSIGSIFRTSPYSVEDVYDGYTGLATGLEVLCRQLGNDGSQRDLELTGYVITLLHLERKLAGQTGLLDELGRGITAIGSDFDEAPTVTPDIAAALAALYTRTLSTLTPRIMVRGEPAILEATDSRNMIRALLLAGMRAAVLWRQCGGSRIRLIFRRKALLAHARTLLQAAGRTA